jgi:hypothetical protein
MLASIYIFCGAFEEASPLYLPPPPLESRLENILTFSSAQRLSFSRHGLSTEKWTTLEDMAKSLARWNERINVVSRKDIDNLIIRHYMPSLALMNLFSSPEATTTAHHGDLTVLQLKTQLKFRGLPISGLKQELIQRLKVDDLMGKKVKGCDTLAGARILDVGTGTEMYQVGYRLLGLLM